MSEASKENNIQTWIGIAAVIALVIFLVKIFGKNKHDIAAQMSREAMYKKIPPSYRDYVYYDFADTLDTALLRESTENEDAVYGVFEQVKNISDVNKIIDMFDKRRKMFTLTWVGLPEAISTFFNKSEKEKLNGILSKKRVPYVFA